MLQPADKIVTRACAALCSALLVPSAFAQQAAPPEDPGIVIGRTVMPRIAYRGVPVEDNPIRTRATVFPSHVFHDTLDNALGDALGDSELGAATGSGGIVMRATGNLLAADAQTGAAGLGLAGASAAGAAPLGTGASVGGAIRGATAGLGDTITGALSNALQPAATGAGSGR
jgi:hypothetical protein